MPISYSELCRNTVNLVKLKLILIFCKVFSSLPDFHVYLPAEKRAVYYIDINFIYETF